MTTKLAVHSLFLTLLCFPAPAASLPGVKPENVGLSAERLGRIHDTIQRHIDARDISGAVTLVARNGRIAYSGAMGVMDLESKKPMPKDAIFRIASMSKPVTGVAILMLVEEGKIRLTDPVSRFIPEFHGMKVAVAAEPQFYTVPAEREITIRDLLTHVSGLVSGPIGTKEAAKVARQANEILADFIPRLARTPLEFQPGTKWAYSPLAAFDTLGRVVEIVSGSTFDQFLKRRIFDPLGMPDTSFYPSEDRLPRVVTNYVKGGNGLKAREKPNFLSSSTYFSGGGGLTSTAEDYLQFGQMLLNGGQLNGKRLLGPRTVEWMASPHVPDTLAGRKKGESFGLSVRVVTDPVAVNYRVSEGSFGWDGAFGTHFWVDPKEKIVGVLMIQTPGQEVARDFENAVMQAIVE